MTSYKSELEIGLPYEICIVVRAYMKEKGGISRKDMKVLMGDINQVINSTTWGKRMGLTVILNLCTLICQLIILATFIRSENK